MNNDNGRGKPVELERVQVALAAWRAAPGKGQRIPEAVWRAAVRAAKKHGLTAVSKALGLDYNGLKRRVAETDNRETARMGLTPEFVEVRAASSPEDMACVIEMEKDGGTRMRICVKSSGAVDWRRIKDAFLGA